MKITLLAILAALGALDARAGSLGFVKVGERYSLQFGLIKASVIVVSDEGGGWYKCRSSNSAEASFVNFNQAIEVSPASYSVTAADAPRAKASEVAAARPAEAVPSESPSAPSMSGAAPAS